MDIVSIKALARSVIYKHLSLSFLYPDLEFYELLKNRMFIKRIRDASTLLKNGKELEKGLRMLEENVKNLTFTSLQAEHRVIFSNIPSNECPPYEAEYGTAHIHQKTKELADVSGFYKAFGLNPSNKIGERFDHISVEFEYMHFLTYGEAYARDKNDANMVEIYVSTQRKFVEEHIGKWVPVFLRLLKKKARKGFYNALVVFASDFVSYEISLLGVNPEEVGKPEISSLAMEDECFSCGSCG